MTEVKTHSQRWNLDVTSTGPTWVEVGGTSYHLGLACRTFLATEGWTKKGAQETGLLDVATRFVHRSSGVIFADEMVMAAMVIEAEGFDLARFLNASPAAVQTVRNQIATEAGVIAQGYRGKGARARRSERMAAIAAQAEAKSAARKAKREARKATA